jgi:hypothetical protein
MASCRSFPVATRAGRVAVDACFIFEKKKLPLDHLLAKRYGRPVTSVNFSRLDCQANRLNSSPFADHILQKRRHQIGLSSAVS